MDKFSVVYIDRNFISLRYPNKPSDGDKLFTHGWGSLSAREFKKYNPSLHVECWKADSRVKGVMVKEIQGVKYRIFPSLNLWKLGQLSWSLIMFMKAWLRTKPKTVFNIASFDHVLFYSLAPLLIKSPLVVQNHGEGTAIYKASINNRYKKIYYNFLKPFEKHSFKYIDLLYVLDYRIKEWLPDNEKQPEIIVRTTGVDISLFNPLDKIKAKAKLGLDSNRKYMLYVGRLNDTKRPDILINIYNDLKEERRDIGLILAGHEKTDPLFQKAVDSGAVMYGVIPQAELYTYLSAADVYLLPRYNENHSFGGIGMLAVQSLLCNTPVIGGSLYNFPEPERHLVGITVSEESGIKNAILSIVDGYRTFKELRAVAVKYYSWEVISRSSAADYYQLLKKYGLNA